MAATAISIEFFPPKDSVGEERLWSVLTHLQPLTPDYISVTYGAGGTSRDRTIKITKELTKRTGIRTVAHLTCVGSSRAELISVLHQYRDANIKAILALRGDPIGGPSAPWVSTPGGLNNSDELVKLAHEFGGFHIGVGAFPDGHPASGGNFSQDIEVLLRKEELGATYATTQFFFKAERWVDLVDRLRAQGSKLPVIAGILPITNVKQLKRMAELGGTPIPPDIEIKFNAIAEDPDAVRGLGVEIATKLCEELIQAGVPGLHFYTMNTARATMEVAANLNLLKHETR